MKSLLNHIKRSLLCIKAVLPIASFITLAAYYVITLCLANELDKETSQAILIFTLITNFFSIIVTYILKRSDYKTFSFHKYDADIIGNNFNGINKKSSQFEKAIELFFNRDIKTALDKFLQIKELNLSESEKAVLSFYIARCYQIMGYFPNSCSYYEDASRYGFDNCLLPLFHARCYADMGELDRAEGMYSDLLKEESPVKPVIRTDIGRMYLMKNKAEKSLKWFMEAIKNHEDYANALGGCAIAFTLMHDFDKGEDYYRQAILNHIPDSEGFTSYYKEVQAVALLEDHPVSST